MDLEQTYDLALRTHHSGQFAEAENLYRQILQQSPNHAETLNSLGALLATMGRLDEAIEFMRKAVASNQSKPAHYCNLGSLLSEKGLLDESLTVCQWALKLDPKSATTHLSLAVTWRRKGDDFRALSECELALEIEPTNSEAHHIAGRIVQDHGDLDQALAAFQRAVQYGPENPEAHHSLGSVYHAKGDYDRAIAAFQKAIELDPQNPAYRRNLAITFANNSQWDQAADAYQQAILVQPNDAELHHKLGATFIKMGDFDRAISACRRAIELRPNYSEAYVSMAISMEEKGEMDQALEFYRQAIRPRPDYARARWNFSLLLLKTGQFAQGWKEYEWRQSTVSGKGMQKFSQPKWDGADISGNTILIHTEQGFGDVIQFSRYIPMVAKRAARVFVLAPPPLVKLLSDNFGSIAQVVEAAPANFDVHCPLLSLPGIFQTELATIPAAAPYLRADPESIEKWKSRMGKQPGDRRPHVGLVWAGNAAHETFRRRSIPPQMLAPLGKIGAIWHSLRKDRPETDLAGALPGVSIIDHSQELTDFSETSALIHNLDLVIGVDTAVTHLAGAMGKPTLVLLQYCAEWRWMLDRDDCPWYPTMRLFRQTRRGDWAEPIQRLAAALQEMLIAR